MTTGGDHVKHIERRRRALSFGIASLVLLAACGSGSDGDASPSSLPFEETTTSVAVSTSVPDTSAETGAPAAGLSAEMFEGMLETDSGRSLLVGSIASETGLEPEAAECLLDAIPLDILVDAAGSFLSGEGDGSFFPADQMETIAPLLDSCNIDVAAFTS